MAKAGGNPRRLPIYDFALKGWFTRSMVGMLETFVPDVLGGSKAVESLNAAVTRLPPLFGDAVFRLEDQRIAHIEFQTLNELNMHWRMMEYRHAFTEMHSADEAFDRQEVVQFVLYAGLPPLEMKKSIRQGNLDFKYHLVDLGANAAKIPILRERYGWTGQFLSLLCTRAAQNDQWAELIATTAGLRQTSARKGFALLHIIHRLRPVSSEVVEELNEMAMHFDIASDPILRPASDMAVARSVVKMAMASGLDVTEADAETLSKLGAESLIDLIGDFMISDDKAALIAGFLPRSRRLK